MFIIIMRLLISDIITIMKVLICGGSGFIGQNLTRFLLNHGHHVVILDKNRSGISSPQLQSFVADLLRPDFFEEKWLQGVEAVINLSGKNIFTFWTGRTKKLIWDSRVMVNRNLIDFIGKLPQKPEVFISASAVGYYGNRGETELLESDQRGEGFLAEVCEAWEKEARRAEDLGMRSVQVRTAPVLLESGGILQQILKSMCFGVTFIFGSGRQWFSWIHMHDLLRIYYEAVMNKNLSGPVNACSPNPVHFKDFINNLIKFKKAIAIPLPAPLVKLTLQETGDVVLFSQRVIPGKLLKAGFQFAYPQLDEALKNIFSVRG